MKKYSVRDVVKLSGVTARTLHYYDRIGLLRPLSRTEAGYRYYGERELLRLQQILFYKELDFPLKAIGELLDDPGFNVIETLEAHKLALQDRQKRIATLLATIDRTINHLKNGKMMSNPEELYEGLPRETGAAYRRGAVEKYGREAVEQSETALLKLGKEGFRQLRQEFQQLNSELFGRRCESPHSDAVQRLIARHYEMIRTFWGTTHSEDPQAEAYAGLGDLYVHDERYTTVEGRPQPEFARFMQQAMAHFADTRLR